ncbi:hypothetical protein RHMOL_Rhmol07G0198200 [Rhododendron molle]|uniref:Uncharacterized protein n=1 Tax=Rhododendron molle TaxID=49168 RepID=A0ACC0N4H6_RHOML|nr:hypothetical protein RHMOL_Rhmol07G0198200 [Rhododendron molle]
MADHGDGSGGGEVIGRPEDRGGPMAIESTEQRPEEAVVSMGAAAASGGDNEQGRQQGVAGEDVRRATEEESRATVEVKPVGPSWS